MTGTFKNKTKRTCRYKLEQNSQGVEPATAERNVSFINCAAWLLNVTKLQSILDREARHFKKYI